MSSRAGLVAAAALLASLAPMAASAENRTTIQVTTVLASNEGRGFDARLASLKDELKPLRFRSYQLVNSETRVLHGNGGQSGVELPGGRYLHLTTREHTPGHVRLHVLLNEDNRPVVNTYLKLELGSVVVIGGPSDDNGTLVLTIGSRPWHNGDCGEVDEKPSPHGGHERGASAPAGELPPLAPLPPTPALSASMPALAAPAAPPSAGR